MLLHILCSIMMMISAIMCAPGQGREDLMPLPCGCEDDSGNYTENPHRGTLDHIGGGNLLRSLDSYTGGQVYRSLFRNPTLVHADGGERENMVRMARNDKTDTSNSMHSIVDPLGGGNLVRSRDSDIKNDNTIIVVDPLGGGNLVSSKDSNTKMDTSTIVVDPLGGGNLVTSRDSDTKMDKSTIVVDPLGGGNLVTSKDSDTKMDKSTIVVDPLGGGNLVMSRDTYTKNDKSRIVVDPLGGGNLVTSRNAYSRMAKLNKHRNSNRHTLDPLGGGHLLRSLDPYMKRPALRSLDGVEGRENIMRLATDNNVNTGSRINGIVDQLGGDNLLSVILQYLYKVGQVQRSLERNQVLDFVEGRQNMMRLAREDKSSNHHDTHGVVDSLGGGNMVRSRDPQILRSHMLDSLDGGEVVRMLDAITGGDLLSTLESAEGAAVLRALKSSGTNKHPKRMLDSVSGWSFGESKRNFDEIDNVGFTGFAKRRNPYAQYRQMSSLAKKNFDEIDRAGFETYNKRNFDEIDRTGFETYNKRAAKE